MREDVVATVVSCHKTSTEEVKDKYYCLLKLFGQSLLCKQESYRGMLYRIKNENMRAGPAVYISSSPSVLTLSGSIFSFARIWLNPSSCREVFG